jgi:hypothetical protein
MKNSLQSVQTNFSAPLSAGEILLYQSEDGKTRFAKSATWVPSEAATR